MLKDEDENMVLHKAPKKARRSKRPISLYHFFQFADWFKKATIFKLMKDRPMKLECDVFKDGSI